LPDVRVYIELLLVLGQIAADFVSVVGLDVVQHRTVALADNIDDAFDIEFTTLRCLLSRQVQTDLSVGHLLRYLPESHPIKFHLVQRRSADIRYKGLPPVRLELR